LRITILLPKGALVKSVVKKIAVNKIALARSAIVRRCCLAATIMASQLSVGLPSAMADAAFTMQRKEGGSVTNGMQMWVREHQMRVSDIAGMDGYLLYDQKARTITQVDEKHKVYRVVDEQAIAQLKSTLQGLQSSVMKQLEGLPQEQRDKMRQALGQFTAQPAAAVEQESLTLRAVSEKREIAGVPCEVVEQYAIKEKVRELCLVSADRLGLLAQDMDVAKSFYNYVRTVASELPGGGALFDQMSLWDPLLEKIPLQVKRLQAGKVSSVYEMSKIDTRPVDAKLFAVPEGYQRVAVLQ